MKNDIRSLLCYGKRRLKERGIGAYALCTELLLMRAAGLDRVKLLTEPEHAVNEEETDIFNGLLDRCAAHEPVQYILSGCEFMSLDFYVDHAVLIPRPDTETLVEEGILRIPRDSRVLDIGTGSGCIAISLAKNIPGIKITAIDISQDAIRIAEKNAVKNNVRESIEFIAGDVWDIDFMEQFDVLISNPPYIKTDDIQKLEENVRDYEPHLALDGGADGLDFYRVIVQKALCWLRSNGVLLFETGAYKADNEQEAVRKILQSAGFSDIWTRKDLTGLDRVIGAILNRSA